MRSIRNRRARVGLLAGALLGTAVVALPTAYVAPPANDRIRQATEVTAIPATYVQDSREATASPGDGECVEGASTWYRYRPTASRTVRAVTMGSSYDTVLAVFRGPRRDRSLVACNDDTRAGFSAVQVDVVAGRTYWIAVSACCREGSRAGRTELRFYAPAPAGVSTTITEVRAGDVSGRLVVEGRSSCAVPSSLVVEMRISQRVGDRVARAWIGRWFRRCTSEARTWRMVADSETGVAFRPGRIVIDLESIARTGFGKAVQRSSAPYTVDEDGDARLVP
jgi:hypothetical protein